MNTIQDLLIEKASELGLNAYPREITDILVENRIRLKCIYGCRDYGQSLSCPPHVMDVDIFRKILNEYSQALLLIENYNLSNEPDVLKAWSYLRKESFHKMLELEYLAFKEGFTYAQLLRPGACNECDTCAEKCRKPEFLRFSPEAVGINLAKTMASVGEEIIFCDSSSVKIIGILLIE